jgi:hypothetical protein
MRNQRHKESNEAGLKSEERFAQVCKFLGYQCIPSNPEDNMKNHIDFIVNRNGEYIGVDVKGLNTADCIWVELKNVKGQPGWLYGGADYIAFDMIDMKGFAIVSRADLKEQVSRVTKCEFVPKHEARHKLYSRENRYDIITRMVWNDVFYLKSFRFLNYAINSQDFTPPHLS